MYLGDSQMFAVPCELREAVWAWSQTAGIAIEYTGTDFGQDVWRVIKPRHSAWFAMRWIS